MSKTGQTPGPNRALTLIEQNVVDSVVNLILDNLTETWRPTANMEFRIQARETRPQMLQVTGPHRDRQEIERQGALETSRRPKARAATQRRVPTAARRGRSARDSAATDEMSERKVRLPLQLANAAAVREKAHAAVR